MSLTRTKRRRRLKNSDKNISDVTLNDFANADKVGTSEVIRKKVGFKALIEEVKSLSLTINTETNEGEEDFSINEQDVSRKRRRRKHRDSDAGMGTSSDDGVSEEVQPEPLQPANVYPLDMWFLIGEYIRPEDVGRFAAICSSTRAVVASPDFWLRLRRRYVCGGHRDSEKNNYALRAQVIRALKQSYTPLIMRPHLFIRTSSGGLGISGGGSQGPGSIGFRNCATFERLLNKAQTIGQRRVLRFTGDHHVVLGACCVQAWQEKRKGSWIYYIKLKHPTRSNDVKLQQNSETTESSSGQDDGTPDCWMSRSVGEEFLGNEDDEKKKIGDIWVNPEEGCKIIEISLDKEQLSNGHFGPCPQILGLSLVWACARQTSATSASSNSRSLALLFGPPHLSPKAASSLLPRLSVGWKSCGGGWAEPVSEAEEIALACGTPLPKGAKCGVKRQSCCKGGSGRGNAGAMKGFSYPEGMVPVVLPGVTAVRLIDWWDADYPFPGEVKNTGLSCGEDEDDHGRWMS